MSPLPLSRFTSSPIGLFAVLARGRVTVLYSATETNASTSPGPSDTGKRQNRYRSLVGSSALGRKRAIRGLGSRFLGWVGCCTSWCWLLLLQYVRALEELRNSQGHERSVLV
jgi:hypothetical protein